MTRHVLDVDDLSAAELAMVLDLARVAPEPVLAGHGVALLMALPSLRTRNSTELGIADLGGHPVAMTGAEVDVDRRESAEDVARALAQLHRLLCVRIHDHQVLERMAGAIDHHGDDVPVVNLLSNRAHPLQAIADLLTIADAVAGGDRAGLAGARLAWVGDGNNVARSFALGAVAVGAHVVAATPEACALSPDDVARIDEVAGRAGLGGRFECTDDPAAAVEGAAAVCTDVWVSMGEEAVRAEKLARFEGFQVDEALLARSPDAFLLHCLPAHRGEEVAAGAVDGPRSLVWHQVRHRRTAVRGLLRWLVAPPRWGR